MAGSKSLRFIKHERILREKKHELVCKKGVDVRGVRSVPCVRHGRVGKVQSLFRLQSTRCQGFPVRGLTTCIPCNLWAFPLVTPDVRISRIRRSQVPLPQADAREGRASYIGISPKLSK